MDVVKPKVFDGQTNGEIQPGIEAENMKPKDLHAPVTEVAAKKRKIRHKKFIDLQKQPPKPKPLIQE